MKKKVLIMAGYYLPSVKGGGPIQSIKNIVDNLSDEFDFYIVSADRDLGDDKPFYNIKTNNWISVGKAKVYYIDKNLLLWRKVEQIIKNVNCDILYLNSFFAFKESIVPIILYKLNRMPNVKVVLAPRGQFSAGALSFKSWKKLLFIKLSLFINLYKEVIWHATTNKEKEDIIKTTGENIKIIVANNLTPNYKNLKFLKNINKNPGELKLVYVARIHPMKNLLQTLKILKNIDGNVEFNIYGPIEDKIYWKKCNIEIAKLSQNIIVKYHGSVQNEEVNQIYIKNHVAILLTLGENFGHSISEALIGGCPVIISDRTPWRNLKKYNVGYDIELNNRNKIIEAVNYFVAIDNYEYKLMSNNAFMYAKKNSNLSKNKYKLLFNA